MKYATPLVAAIMAGALTACVTDSAATSVVSATPNTATIRFEEGNLNAATEHAQAVCSNYSRTAQLRAVVPTQGNERIASYECV